MELIISDDDRNMIDFLDLVDYDSHIWQINDLNAYLYYHQLRDSVELIFNRNNIHIGASNNNILNVYTDIQVEIQTLLSVTEPPIKFLDNEIIAVENDTLVVRNVGNQRVGEQASPEFKSYLSGAYGEAIIHYLFHHFNNNDDYAIAKMLRVHKSKTPDFMIFNRTNSEPQIFWEAKGTVKNLPTEDTLRNQKYSSKGQIQTFIRYLYSKDFIFSSNGVFSKLLVPLYSNRPLALRVVDPVQLFSLDLPEVLLRNILLKDIIQGVDLKEVNDKYEIIKNHFRGQISELNELKETINSNGNKLVEQGKNLLESKNNNPTDYENYLVELLSSDEYNNLKIVQEKYIISLLNEIDEVSVNNIFSSLNREEEKLINDLGDRLTT